MLSVPQTRLFISNATEGFGQYLLLEHASPLHKATIQKPLLDSRWRINNRRLSSGCVLSGGGFHYFWLYIEQLATFSPSWTRACFFFPPFWKRLLLFIPLFLFNKLNFDSFLFTGCFILSSANKCRLYFHEILRRHRSFFCIKAWRMGLISMPLIHLLESDTEK